MKKIYEIKSDLLYDNVIIKGRVEKINWGFLYKISDGNLLEVFENFSLLKMVKDFGIIVSKRGKINCGKLTSIDIKNVMILSIKIFRVCNKI